MTTKTGDRTVVVARNYGAKLEVDPTNGRAALWFSTDGAWTEAIRFDATHVTPLGGAGTVFDANGNELIKFGTTASAVNEVTITNAATASGPQISATGGDTNIDLRLLAKGTGAVKIDNGTDPVLLALMGAVAGYNSSIVDLNGNELIDFQGIASAVNQLAITNAITAVNPTLGVRGGDTNISLRFAAKGTAYIHYDNRHMQAGAATVDSTAGALTITAAMVAGGLLVRDPNGAGRSDVTPAASLLVAAFPGCKVGDIIPLTILNNADAAETITITAGANATFGATQKTHTIVQNASLTLQFRLTNVTLSSEAYVIYD